MHRFLFSKEFLYLSTTHLTNKKGAAGLSEEVSSHPGKIRKWLKQQSFKTN